MICVNNIKRSLLFIILILIELIAITVIRCYIDHLTAVNADNNRSMLEIDNNIINDLKCFPVPLSYRSEITFQDDYNAKRADKFHEGCDIMDSLNVPGRIPVVSATDGIVTNIGWLYLGGYRIGITSDNKIYYYYAHLDSYANGIKVGDKIVAGQLIGFMGNTGEGEEGTRGKFPVHLHFGIYTGMDNADEKAVDPYMYLVYIMS